MKIENLGLHDVLERMGDGYSREEAQEMLTLIKAEQVDDTRDISDARWLELCNRACVDR